MAGLGLDLNGAQDVSLLSRVKRLSESGRKLPELVARERHRARDSNVLAFVVETGQRGAPLYRGLDLFRPLPRSFDIRARGFGADENMTDHSLCTSDPLHLEDVGAELSVHYAADFLSEEAEGCILKLLDHHSPTDPPELPSPLSRTWIIRKPPRQVAEVFSFLEKREDF